MAEIVDKNPVNEPTQKPVKTHSKFTPNYSLFTGHQYGLNTPVFGMECLADETNSLRTSIDTDTYTLQAPAMVPVKRNLDFFQVPLRAVIPNSADLLITNPLQGDDVEELNVNTVFNPGTTNWTRLLSRIVGNLTSFVASGWTSDSILGILRTIQFGNLFFSRGSLAANLGIDFGDCAIIGNQSSDGSITRLSWDQFVDSFFAFLKRNFSYIRVRWNMSTEFTSGNVYPESSLNHYTNVDLDISYQDKNSSDAFTLAQFRDMLFFEPAGLYSITLSTRSGVTLPSTIGDDDASIYTFAATDVVPDQYVNYGKCVAYQVACSEFFTVDTVDDIYSAKLYHDNMNSLFYYLLTLNGNVANYFYAVNGVRVAYDGVSGYAFNTALGLAYDFILVTSTSYNPLVYLYFQNILGYTRTLRYQDYFVGSRLNPLAVGDVNVSVNNSKVDVIDISRNIQVQRFLNQVNRVGRKFSEYVKGILGSKPMPDPHDPLFLAHITDTIGAEETQNTASEQYSTSTGITAKFRNNSSRFIFTTQSSEPGYIIGIASYVLQHAYRRGTDRENMHTNRYDMFNPYMQFVGDQPVYNDELEPGTGSTFSYQIRYAEYRQRVDRAAGPFADDRLPGYAFVLGRADLSPLHSSSGDIVLPSELNSDFIREKVQDITPFYLSLTEYSLAGRFNFICRIDNEVTSHRPLAYAPSIL